MGGGVEKTKGLTIIDGEPMMAGEHLLVRGLITLDRESGLDLIDGGVILLDSTTVAAE